MRHVLPFLLLLLLPDLASAQAYDLDAPVVVLHGVSFTVTVESEDVLFDEASAEQYTLRMDGEAYPLTYQRAGERQLVAEELVVEGGPVSYELVHEGTVVAQATSRSVPGWWSIVPPVLAILVALAFKRVIPALFLGVWVGAWVAIELSLTGLWRGLLEAFQVYVLAALADPDHAAIILFSLMIGGMVGIISKNGGTQGIVNKIVRWAKTPRKGQIATGILGLAIFFDDYANTLVVGNTMRPVTDRLRISREKLAYVVDSTAAPVSCLAFVTTWIGYEVGIIGEAVAKIPGFNESAYSIFLNSIPYSFYPILAIFFVFSVANSRRDFGAMYRAEYRARSTGQVLGEHAKVDEAAAEGKELAAKEGQPQRAFNAVIPILVLVAGVFAGLYVTGSNAVAEMVAAGESVEPGLRGIIGEADSYRSLMWASLLGVLTAAVLSIGQRILDLEETVEAWYGGLKSMLFAMIILVLAWALSEITGVLHTADYLVALVGESLNPGFVPALVFILAAATAFATGSSWGTMGILMPLVIPLAWAVLQADGLHTQSEYYHIIYSTTSVVLAGAVWGDHCSPISDTTILSSMASGCDHIEHVRTQIPYAMTVGLVALLLGTLPTGFGFPWWASLLIGAAVLAFGLRFFGERVADELPPETLEEIKAEAAASIQA